MTLTEADWESRAAKISAFAIFILAALTLATALALALAIATALAPLSAIATLSAIAIATALATLSDNKSSRWYYIFRFPGAVWHHYLGKVRP